MSGDSAGGNLVAAMHVYMLQNKLAEFSAHHLLLVCVAQAHSTPALELIFELIALHLEQIFGIHGFLHRNDAQPHTLPL